MTESTMETVSFLRHFQEQVRITLAWDDPALDRGLD